MKLKIALLILTLILCINIVQASVVYTGTHWDTESSGNGNPGGITMNDTHFWIVDTIDDKVYQYHHNGTYTGTSWSTTLSGNNFPIGIAMNDAYFWITDDGLDIARQHYHNGTYTGVYCNNEAVGNTGAKSITMNDTHFWTTDSVHKKVFEYYINGTYTGTSWSTTLSGNNFPNGITMNDTYLWVSDIIGEKIYQYYHNGTYTGTYWDTNGGYTPYDITTNGTYFWIVSKTETEPLLSNEVYLFYTNIVPITTELKTESLTNPTQISTNVSTPFFNWTYTDPNETQYSWEIQVGTASGLSDMWESGQLLGTDINDVYAGSTLSRNTTYYVQVRTNDSYENSAWETGTFKINALPVISNIIITPSAPIDTDDLTANNDTATDGNGDSITLYHRWYKDDVLQPALNDITTVLAANLTDGDIWKLAIIPNDGYENGTEIFSGTVTIGSGNYVPTLTGIESNLTTRKYNQSVTISTQNAYDQNDDNYTLHVGTAAGLSDLCNSSSTANGTEASCSFPIPWTSGIHTIYGRLTDQNDTSIEYQEVITVDVTPPSIDSSSVSPASGTTDTTYQLSASISIANGSISSVTVCVGQIGASCTNHTMSLSGANYIHNFSTGSAGSYITTIYSTDNSGNSASATGPSFTITTGSSGGGGGGATNVTINETILGDLTLLPGRLDTYFILFGNEGTASYRFTANRVVDSCTSELGRCEISEGYIIRVFYDINRSVKAIEDKITVADSENYTADAVVIVRIIQLDSFIPFGIEIPVGEGLGSFLSVFFEVINNTVIGVKSWFLVSLVGALGYFGYKGYQ